MDQWSNGPMDQWTNGPMDQWTNGPMDQWTDGPMYRWISISIWSFLDINIDRKSLRNIDSQIQTSISRIFFLNFPKSSFVFDGWSLPHVSNSGHLFLLRAKTDCVSVCQTPGWMEGQCCQGRMRRSRRTSLLLCSLTATVTTLRTKSNGKPVRQVGWKVKPQKVSKQYHGLDSCFLK